MLKNLFFIACILQLSCTFGQDTLEQVLKDLSYNHLYNADSVYYDDPSGIIGIPIIGNHEILKSLELEPTDSANYYINGLYQTKDIWVLFISKFKIEEEIHFAILLDQNLDIIDRLEETAYTNLEGFKTVNSILKDNELTKCTYNFNTTPKGTMEDYIITDQGFINGIKTVVSDEESSLNNPEADSDNKGMLEKTLNSAGSK